MNSHIPFKMSKTRHSLPWIDPQIKRQMRKRDRLYVKAKKSNVPRDWSLFKQHRNKLAKTGSSSPHELCQQCCGS